MNRQQRRQAQRQKAKQPRPIIVPQYAQKQLNQIKEEATDNAVATAFSLLFSIPMWVMYHRYEWDNESLAILFDEIAAEYNDFTNSDRTLEEYQDFVYEHIGAKMQVSDD